MRKYKFDSEKIRKELPRGSVAIISRKLEVTPSAVTQFLNRGQVNTLRDSQWLTLIYDFRDAYNQQIKLLAAAE